jgi:flagellar motor switch protein FliN
MAEDKPISQDDIEKLLSQASGPAAPAKNPAPPSSPPIASAPSELASKIVAESQATSVSASDTDKMLAQDDIEKLLNQAGISSAPAKAKEDTSGPFVGEGSMAEKDIEYLLNQAERALESIGSTAQNDLPQGVSAFRLQELSGAPASTETATLDLVRDVELDLKIELGRTHMYLEDVLKLRKGSVVPLDKLAGDPVDVYVNGRLVARGEVLVLNDNFCVRVAELIAGANVFNAP